MTGQAYRDGPPSREAPLWPGWWRMLSLTTFVAVFLVPMVALWWFTR